MKKQSAKQRAEKYGNANYTSGTFACSDAKLAFLAGFRARGRADVAAVKEDWALLYLKHAGMGGDFLTALQSKIKKVGK